MLVYVAEFAGSGRPAVAMGLVFPLLGCFFGVWMGATWLRGRRACLWFVPKVVLSIILAAVLLGIPVWLSLERTPLSFEAAQVTSAEKRRLVDLLHGKNPLALDDNETCTLRLTEHDLNVLLSWGLSLGSPARKASVRSGPGFGRTGADRSACRWVGQRYRYLNLELAGGAGVQDGALRLEVDRCRLGCIEMPRRLLGLPFVPRCIATQSRPALAAVSEGHSRNADRAEPLSSWPTAVCACRRRLRRELFGPTAVNEEVLASTQAQIDHLLAVIRPLRPAQRTFGLCFETVFTLARERSVGRDAIKENQAGIFALGILLGHPRIEEILGLAGAGDGRPAARHALIRIVLRGRSDWTRHFCVSAVLAVLSDEAVSGAAGLLKEELDGDTGGSGFSFSDLLADRAGTTFAIQATRDEASARAMQERLAGGFRIDEFFPPAADLPEGIPDAQIQSRVRRRGRGRLPSPDRGDRAARYRLCGVSLTRVRVGWHRQGLLDDGLTHTGTVVIAKSIARF